MIEIAAECIYSCQLRCIEKYPAIVVASQWWCEKAGCRTFTRGVGPNRFHNHCCRCSISGRQWWRAVIPTNQPTGLIDIRGMADFISSYAGLMLQSSWCLGHLRWRWIYLKAAQSDKLFKTVSTLSMFNSGGWDVMGFQNSPISNHSRTYKKASDARTKLLVKLSMRVWPV